MAEVKQVKIWLLAILCGLLILMNSNGNVKCAYH